MSKFRLVSYCNSYVTDVKLAAFLGNKKPCVKPLLTQGCVNYGNPQSFMECQLPQSAP